MFLYLPLQVILSFTMKHYFDFSYKLPPFQWLFLFFLLLSILKFARLVQIHWLEVKHHIFNWFEFQLLNFRLNKNGFEISLNRKPVCEFPLKEPFE